MAASLLASTGAKAGAHQTVSVDLESIFAALAEAQEKEQCGRPCDAYSIEELSHILRRGIVETRKLVKRALAEGVCQYTPKPMRSIAGYLCKRPAYRFIQPIK